MTYYLRDKETGQTQVLKNQGWVDLYVETLVRRFGYKYELRTPAHTIIVKG